MLAAASGMVTVASLLSVVKASLTAPIFNLSLCRFISFSARSRDDGQTCPLMSNSMTSCSFVFMLLQPYGAVRQPRSRLVQHADELRRQAFRLEPRSDADEG